MSDVPLVRWREWCEGPIRHHVINIYAQRYVWQRLHEMLAENPNLPASYWWTYLQETYAVSQAVAIRRQADRDKRVISLARLIGTVQANAKSITREGWLAMWADPDDHPHATELWETKYGDSSGKRLDRAVPAADLKRLTAAARHVKRYVDQHVAHTDSSAVAEPVTLTYDDLHDAVDVVGELFKKYHHLLTAESYGSLVPIDIHPSWEAVFTQPWKTQPPATATSATR